MLKVLTRPYRDRDPDEGGMLALGKRFRLPDGYAFASSLWSRRLGEDSSWLGGDWGYSQDGAVVLHRMTAASSVSCRNMEDRFIEFRLQEELFHSRVPSCRYLGISWTRRNERQLFGLAAYHRIEVDVFAVQALDWARLASDWRANCGYSDDILGLRQHQLILAGKQIRFREVFWFDVSDFG